MSEENKKPEASTEAEVKQSSDTSKSNKENTAPASSPSDSAPAAADDPEEKKRKAAEARAARAAAREKKKAEEEAEEEIPKAPSPNQPKLDRLVAAIEEQFGKDAIEDHVVNELGYHIPTLTIREANLLQIAGWLKETEPWKMTFLRNLSGVDQESHLEAVYHLVNVHTADEICLKVKADREQASIASVTAIWSTANWHEREIYDLLGIDFPGHPDLRRIMMPDDWEGYPLRKDYEPADPEV
ncbi:NADH-quinone oxidoreductase subunit C [Marinicrinis sediminis]|uniref:NADH-quinone oxidoreductase n=1 Tax=Marinicrinis sediminis TaxID=1652465 RepID=A0ABW5RAJ1_9BACL